ncbi:MAG: efflux RND transporter periplasmic adaptor subunit [Sedimentisphaerales bacterium]
MNMKKFLEFTLFSGVMLLCGQAYAGSNQPLKAITKPCADVTLSFVQPGTIAKINYKEGDLVHVGDVLVQQDDSVEQIKLEQLKAESEDTTTIKHAEITLQQRDVDLKRLEDRPEATTETEIEYARLNQQIAQLQLHIAQFQHEQAIRKYEEAKKQLDRMTLKSPIDGRVEKIDAVKGEEVEEGESVNALQDVIRIVRIDPLWIDVPVPFAQTANLRNGAKALVDFPEPKRMTLEGQVIFISSVGQAGSDTLTIRVQVPNKSNRPASENVLVSFPASS